MASHEPRLNFHAHAKQAAKALTSLSLVAAAGLDARLHELVCLRVSQINGCAFCIDMHWAALVAADMDPRHINAVAGWREAQRFFSDRKRAALNWAEAVNAVPQRTPSDADFDEVRQHFSDAEIAALSFAICAVRSWNVLNASFRTQVPETPWVAH